MKLLTTCILSFISVGGAIGRLRGGCNQQVVYQAHDPNLDAVVNVIARDSERLLVLANGSDYSSPCTSGVGWWMEHEVQGTVTCRKAAGGARVAQTGADCPACEPQVNTMGGYFRSIAALSVLTPEGHARNPQKVMIIGLGAGLIPSWFAANSDAHVDVVDISDAVVQASPCFGLRAGPKLSLHAEDGRRFLADAPDASYDTIIVDAFDGSASMPVCMRSVEFFTLAAKKMNKRGVLLLNLLTCGSDKDSSTCGSFRDSVVASVQQAFSTTHLAQAPGSCGSQSVLAARSQQQGIVDVGVDSVGQAAHAWFQEAAVQKLPQVEAQSAFHDAVSC